MSHNSADLSNLNLTSVNFTKICQFRFHIYWFTITLEWSVTNGHSQASHSHSTAVFEIRCDRLGIFHTINPIFNKDNKLPRRPLVILCTMLRSTYFSLVWHYMEINWNRWILKAEIFIFHPKCKNAIDTRIFVFFYSIISWFIFQDTLNYIPF